MGSEGDTTAPGGWLARWRMRRDLRGPLATGFAREPEPRTTGLYARGRQLLDGHVLFAGFLVEAPGVSLWQIASPHPAFTAEAQGFRWLDDLAALGSFEARRRAVDWLGDWIARYGAGQGPGWAAPVVGRRVLRLVGHSGFLLGGREAPVRAALLETLSRQAAFLSRRAAAAPAGLPRVEALTGLCIATLTLEGFSENLPPALAALTRACNEAVSADGALASRNPEDLLEVFVLLTLCASALRAADRAVPQALDDTIRRIAPTLRALRHADGGLARFHGGGRGVEGRLDRALAESGTRPLAHPARAMGYARLSAGRTTVIVDAAPPPRGAAAATAHASTLALELTSGRRPLVTSCGSGAKFGPDWHRAGRATPSHSTLMLEGVSSSRLGPAPRGGDGLDEPLVDGPGEVSLTVDVDKDGARMMASHDGYRAGYGLTHVRELILSPDGRTLVGEDSLVPLVPHDRPQLMAALGQRPEGLWPVELRFHLYPDVDATLDLNGTAISMALRSGEIWVFRHDGTCTLSLEPSVYLERGRLEPRAARQIVLRARLGAPGLQIGWTLSKATDTPQAIRDTVPDEPPEALP